MTRRLALCAALLALSPLIVAAGAMAGGALFAIGLARILWDLLSL